jgi:hypothetical protein
VVVGYIAAVALGCLFLHWLGDAQLIRISGGRSMIRTNRFQQFLRGLAIGISQPVRLDVWSIGKDLRPQNQIDREIEAEWRRRVRRNEERRELARRAAAAAQAAAAEAALAIPQLLARQAD